MRIVRISRKQMTTRRVMRTGMRSHIGFYYNAKICLCKGNAEKSVLSVA
jgi:hypothetical protein